MMFRWAARRVAGLCTASLVALVTGCAMAPTDETPAPGYVTLDPPQPIATGERIELIEFFWYRCPHCNALYPELKDWLKTLPPDVQIRYHHAVFRDSMENGARIHYTLQALGESDDRIGQVFEAYFLDALDFNDDDVLFDWIAHQGIDRQRFVATYRSAAIDQQVAQARQRSLDYRLPGVPAFVVDGKYLTSNSLSGDVALLQRVEQLIERARSERAAARR